MCYVGSQTFEAKEVIKYILVHYYDYVVDIIQNLSLDDTELIDFLKDYLELIPADKLGHIFYYLKDKINYICNFDKQNKL